MSRLEGMRPGPGFICQELEKESSSGEASGSLSPGVETVKMLDNHPECWVTAKPPAVRRE